MAKRMSQADYIYARFFRCVDDFDYAVDPNDQLQAYDRMIILKEAMEEIRIEHPSEQMTADLANMKEAIEFRKEEARDIYKEKEKNYV